MFDIVGKRIWFFLVSGILITLSIISLASPFGRLKMANEFTGGFQLRIHFEQQVSQSDLRAELNSLGYGSATIQSEIETGQDYFLIRFAALSAQEKDQLEAGLQSKFGTLFEDDFSDVSAEIATETLGVAGIAVAIAAIGMLLYIAWAFRTMPHPFRYGTAAITAMVHDVLIAVGVFSLLSGLLNWEVNLMFLTGILTVLGYSINNTVIIFDRIRENVINGVSPHFEVVVNNSVVETLGRTLNTSLTTLFAVVALMLFVGATIQNFAIVLLVGIVIGMFDSICVAPMFLVLWDKHEWGRLVPFRSRAAVSQK